MAMVFVRESEMFVENQQRLRAQWVVLSFIFWLLLFKSDVEKFSFRRVGT